MGRQRGTAWPWVPPLSPAVPVPGGSLGSGSASLARSRVQMPAPSVRPAAKLRAERPDQFCSCPRALASGSCLLSAFQAPAETAPRASRETSAASAPARGVDPPLPPQALLKPGPASPLCRSPAAPPSAANPQGCFPQVSPLPSLRLRPRSPPLAARGPRELGNVALGTHARIFALLPGESWPCCAFSCCLSEKGTGGPF